MVKLNVKEGEERATRKVELPEKLVELFSGEARYRVAYGGRGSGKTRSFALMAVLKAYQLSEAGKRGVIVCAREYMNSTTMSLQAEIEEAIYRLAWLRQYFEVTRTQIRTKNNRIEFNFIGLNRNIASLKSMANIHIFWVDEAEMVSEEAWQHLIPTVREEDSEIWVSYNPVSKHSAVHKRFREQEHNKALLRMKIVEINWRDNPWFPKVLDEERLHDKTLRPEYYAHIWEGEFKEYFTGAYFTSELLKAREEGRIGNVACDPLMSFRSFWDIGGSGAKADATAIWIAQFIGNEVRVLDYYEAAGQPLATHIDWLRRHGYGRALVTLPHDGRTMDRVFDISFERALTDAGFEVNVVANQGAGAARLRIEAARRVFNRLWFNENTTRAGIEALNWYHEKRDEIRGIGLGPDHDWSSHAADAFGLMCLAVAEQGQSQRQNTRYSGQSYSGSWMSV